MSGHVVKARGNNGYRGQHEPQGWGRCKHRWANRVTKVVRCAWAEGYTAGVQAGRAELLWQRAIDHGASRHEPGPDGTCRCGGCHWTSPEGWVCSAPESEHDGSWALGHHYQSGPA